MPLWMPTFKTRMPVPTPAQPYLVCFSEFGVDEGSGCLAMYGVQVTNACAPSWDPIEVCPEDAIGRCDYEFDGTRTVTRHYAPYSLDLARAACEGLPGAVFQVNP